MKIFSYMEQYDYEQLVFCQDEASGLKAIIAIHDTTLGPALGGTRMWTYESEEAAIEEGFAAVAHFRGAAARRRPPAGPWPGSTCPRRGPAARRPSPRTRPNGSPRWTG